MDSLSATGATIASRALRAWLPGLVALLWRHSRVGVTTASLIGSVVRSYMSSPPMGLFFYVLSPKVPFSPRIGSRFASPREGAAFRPRGCLLTTQRLEANQNGGLISKRTPNSFKGPILTLGFAGSSILVSEPRYSPYAPHPQPYLRFLY